MIIETFRQAIQNVWSNKLRTFLTMLGIIIGICAVITIMTLGQSVTNKFTDSMQSIGASNVTVMIQQKADEDEDGDAAQGMMFMAAENQKVPTEKDYITDDMLSSLRENYDSEMLGIALSETVGTGKAEKGKLYANVTVMGINGDYFLSNPPAVLSGRMLTADELGGDRRIAVVSDKLVNNLFGGKNGNAIGETLEVTVGDSFYEYTIVGVYQYEQNVYMMNFGSEKDINTNVYIPIGTAQAATHSTAGYTMATVISAPFASRVERYLNAYYRTNRNFKVSAFSMESMVSQFASVLGTIQTAISVIAGISLLVGGIGVMNIMLVSITERTREIGTCKALGATNTSIRLQFIIEAVIICLIGGAIGVALGIAAGSIASNALGFPAKASIESILIALGFSMTIGVFFGYYPANKAAKMDPINALRYE